MKGKLQNNKILLAILISTLIVLKCSSDISNNSSKKENKSTLKELPLSIIRIINLIKNLNFI